MHERLLKSEGERLGFTYPSKVHVIHTPLRHAYLNDLRVDLPGRSGLLFAGSLIGRKNPAAVLEAAGSCGGPVTIVGEGPDEAELRSLATRLEIAEPVTWSGWAPVERLQRLLLGAEMLCVPSASEGFSATYVEALACGTPIVGMAANIEELSARIGASCGIGIVHGSGDEVAAAVRAVRKTGWDHADLRRRALSAFSPKANTSAYADALWDGAGGRSRVGRRVIEDFPIAETSRLERRRGRAG